MKSDASRICVQYIDTELKQKAWERCTAIFFCQDRFLTSFVLFSSDRYGLFLLTATDHPYKLKDGNLK